MNNSLINVGDLDFDGIKANIKTFLQGQDVFSDYNFEGSVLSTLLDVLAYNTHLNALYTNLAVNESFIDSASKYSSVVSLAKSIGYTPKSTKSSYATLTIAVSNVPGNPATLTLPRFTSFKSDINGVKYSFLTTETHTALNVANVFTFNVDVTEGFVASNNYTTGINTQYVIPNRSIDMSTISVQVQENTNSSLLTTFKLVDDLLTVKNIDAVFFVKQREDLFYEIYFGNDVIGKAVVPGNVVFLDYLVSSGVASNGCSEFYYSSGFRSDVIYTITTNEVSRGGADPESIDSIKFNAPRVYTSQNRAVTADDYESQVKINFPQIERIKVWGGQDNVPPQYGKVFISAKPYGRDKLDDQEKLDIKTFLSTKRSVVSIQQVFTDPVVLNIALTSHVYFNADLTTKTADELATLILSNIQTYANSLNTFDSSFRYSKLIGMIDGTDPSILSNITSITISRNVTPIFGVKTNYNIDIGNPIYSVQNSVRSSRFYIPGVSNTIFIRSETDGTLSLMNKFPDGTETFISQIGTLNFTTGKIEIKELLITALFDDDFNFVIQPSSNDVIPVRENLIALPSDLISLTVVAESQDHLFSASR